MGNKGLILFQIISRGSLLISIGSKFVVANGELTFDPPIFYVDSASLRVWSEPVDVRITHEELALIKNASKTSEANGTKISFD